MKLAVDTNIFGYAAGIGDDDAKRARAGWLLKAIPPFQLVMPSQVAGELYNLLCRKGGQKPKIATKIVLDWIDALTFAPQGPGTLREALQTASFQNLQMGRPDHKYRVRGGLQRSPVRRFTGWVYLSRCDLGESFR